MGRSQAMVEHVDGAVPEVEESEEDEDEASTFLHYRDF